MICGRAMHASNEAPRMRIFHKTQKCLVETRRPDHRIKHTIKKSKPSQR